MKTFKIKYLETCTSDVQANTLEEALQLIKSIDYRMDVLTRTTVEKFELITTTKTPTGQERNMFEAFRVKYRGKKRGLETELANLLKHKDWSNIIGQLYQDKDKYYKDENVKYIPHLATFINQRRWEMVEDDKPTVNPYGEQHNWSTK